MQTGPFAGRPVPQSRPGADWQFRPRGPRLAPLFRHAFRKGALNERDLGYVTEMGTNVKERRYIRDIRDGFLALTRLNHPYTIHTDCTQMVKRGRERISAPTEAK